MTVTAKNAISGLPVIDDWIVAGNANATTNTINPGDWIVLSGSGIAAADDTARCAPAVEGWSPRCGRLLWSIS